MSNLIREEKYIKTMADKNKNKVWFIRQYDDNTIVTEFGRVRENNKGLQSRSKVFPSEAAATKFVEKKIREKLRDGRNGEIPYRPMDKMLDTGSASNVKVIEHNNLAQIAKEDITFNSPEVEKLLNYLTKTNVHNITSNTKLTYNADTGLFQTPYGIVSKEGIDESRDYLSIIGQHVQDDTLDGKEFINALNNFLMLIPQDIGMKNPKTLFQTQDDVYKQNDILDSLEASYQQILTQPVDNDSGKTKKREKVFNTQLDLVEDGKIIDRIIRKYNDTKSGMHVSSSLKVKKVYTVTIEAMSKAFKNNGMSLKNIREFWHGTRCGNLLSIARSGLCVVPSTASHVCGRMWSDGLYFADSSSKSLNYSVGYWDSKSYDTNCFMFLANVALGKEHFPKRGDSWGYKLPKGYNSTTATVANTGLKHNEYVVPNAYQCDLTYLIEFSK